MSRWRPSPDEERWLEVASELGALVPRAAMAERTGGWRSTGPMARIALFVLGLVAAALLFAILGYGNETNLLVAGLIAVLAAEWLTVDQAPVCIGHRGGPLCRRVPLDRCLDHAWSLRRRRASPGAPSRRWC